MAKIEAFLPDADHLINLQRTFWTMHLQLLVYIT